MGYLPPNAKPLAVLEMVIVEVLVYLTANSKRGGISMIWIPTSADHGEVHIATSVSAVYGIVAFTISRRSTVIVCLC